MGGAEFGPLNVSRLPIRSGLVAVLRAMPAHAPGEAANGTLAAATPIPARFRNSRRSMDRVVLSSPLIGQPPVGRSRRLLPGRRFPFPPRRPTLQRLRIGVKIAGEIVANLVAGRGFPYARPA